MLSSLVTNLKCMFRYAVAYYLVTSTKPQIGTMSFAYRKKFMTVRDFCV